MSYKIITDSFFEIFSKINYLLLTEMNIKNNNFLEKLNEDKKNKIVNITNDFIKIIKKFKSNNMLLQGLIDKNYTDLNKLKYILLGLKTSNARSCVDILFKNILHFHSNMPLGITITFENFVKGITYFNDEKENKNQIPIYHRAASCGNKRKNFRDLISQIHIFEEDKKKYIFKCYLERLIYDNMYKHLTLHFPKNSNTQELTQNKGHLHQLNERAQNYYNHFLGEDIKIELLYDNLFPSVLNVFYFTNNQLQRTDRFLKSTYIDDYGNTQYSSNVYCTKIENNNEIHYVQSF